jgi:outer membrane protein TolC
MTSSIFILIFSISFTASASVERVFNLEDYLNQVRSQNETIKSNSLASLAFRLRVGEASLDFMPTGTGNLTYSDDKRQQSLTTYLGTEAVAESGTLGAQEKLRTGTLLGFSYNLSANQYFNSPFFNPVGSYSLYTASPQLSITQPLWKDFNASLSKANEESVLQSLKAQEISSLYSTQQIVLNAENIYWTLALDREIVRLDSESIERTTRILKRNEKRVSMNVTDKSDLLQSLASLKTKELTYQKDLEDLRQASMQFNSFRNVSNDSVPESLQNVNGFLDLDIGREIIRKGVRSDVLVAVANAQSQKASAEASRIKNLPDIELGGTYQFDGRGFDSATAMGTSWNADNPYLTASLKLTVPLDQGVVSTLNEGYRAQAASAEAAVERAKFDLDQDWLDLQKHFKDAMSRLSLARELEKLQGEKLKWERERFNLGRTTSFQVLQFEDNYSDASLSRLRVESELITIRAKARLYNGEVQ